MAAVAALLSLCFGALSPCPSGVGSQCIGEFASGLEYPKSIAVSHDDTLAAVESGDGFHVYNIITGAALTLPFNYTEAKPAFSPDGSKLAVALGSTGVAVVSTNGTELWSASETGHCFSVAYSPDGTRVASGHKGGNISIWDAETGDLVLSLTGLFHRRQDEIRSLAFTIDGGRIISGSSDQKVVVWDATTGALVKRLADHAYDALFIQVSPDGLYFASLGQGKTDPVIIYKLSDYSIHKRIRNGRRTYDMSFSHDWSKVVLVGYGMEVYSVETGKLLQSHTMPSGRTYGASYFHTSDTIITGKYRKPASLLLWNDVGAIPPPTPATPDTPLPPCPSDAGPQCTKMLARVRGSLRRIAVSPDDALIAVVADVRLLVYNVTTGAILPVHSPYLVYDVAFSPDARNVAVALGDGGVAVVSLSSGTELWFGKMTGRCNAVACSPDGTRVASSDEVNIYIWNAQTGALELTLPGRGWVRWDQLTYTMDGGRLISVQTFWGEEVVVWNATTGNSLKTLEYERGVVSAPVSPDGLYFATMTTDGTISIYKLSDYSIHQRFSVGNTRSLYSSFMSFSHDWSKVVVETDAGGMEVYSVETGKLLQSHTLPSGVTDEASYFHTTDAIITGTEGGDSGNGLLLWDDVAPRVCTSNNSCRVFGDRTAKCTSSQHCACGTHSGALCEIPATDMHMSVVITLQVLCNRTGLQALLDTLRAEATARGVQNVTVGASCGTLSVALSGVVPGATVSATSDALVDALGAAAVAHSDLTNIMHASQLDPFVQIAQTSGWNTIEVCTQGALSTVQTHDGRCLVLTCNDGSPPSVETRDGKDYHTCTHADDDLSTGAIAGIVVGSVLAVVVLAALLVWCVRRAPDAGQARTESAGATHRAPSQRSC